MSQAPEKTGVETPALDWLVRLGYTHLPGAAVKVEHRHLAPVLEEVLRPRLLTLNPWLAEAPGRVDSALIELRKRANDELLAANQAVWQQVLHRSDIQVKDLAGQPRSVRFLDATDASRNDFHVVDQYVGRNADGELFRPDLLLLVNEPAAGHHRMQGQPSSTGRGAGPTGRLPAQLCGAVRVQPDLRGPEPPPGPLRRHPH